MRKQNDLGKGVATAGIWIGVGISAFSCGMFTVIIAVCALGATAAVWD